MMHTYHLLLLPDTNGDMATWRYSWSTLQVLKHHCKKFETSQMDPKQAGPTSEKKKTSNFWDPTTKCRSPPWYLGRRSDTSRSTWKLNWSFLIQRVRASCLTDLFKTYINPKHKNISKNKQGLYWPWSLFLGGVVSCCVCKDFVAYFSGPLAFRLRRWHSHAFFIQKFSHMPLTVTANSHEICSKQEFKLQ